MRPVHCTHSLRRRYTNPIQRDFVRCHTIFLDPKYVHNEELSGLYSLPNIVRVVKSRRMRWAGHARMGYERGVHRVLVGKLEGKSHWGDPDVDGRTILRYIFRKWEGGCGDWMELAQDRDRWRALVNRVRNLRVPKMRGIS